MEYYNIDSIVRINVINATESNNWSIFPLKSASKVDFFLSHSFWKKNQKSPVYNYVFSLYNDDFTIDNIKEYLLDTEYLDEVTQMIMEYPMVVIFLSDGSNTAIHFKDYDSALKYADRLISKSNHFIELNKI